jgi:glutamine synthetase
MPPEAVKENLYQMSSEELKQKHIELLPSDLREAIEELKKDRMVQSVLGEHITAKYIEAKEAEWKQYRAQITDWEINEYLYKI